MTVHGQIGEFHGDLEWSSLYVEQLGCYFMANNVADTRVAVAPRAFTMQCVMHVGRKVRSSGHVEARTRLRVLR